MIIIAWCIALSETVQEGVEARHYGTTGTQEILAISDDFYYKLPVLQEVRKDRLFTEQEIKSAVYEAGVVSFNECLTRYGL